MSRKFLALLCTLSFPMSFGACGETSDAGLGGNPDASGGTGGGATQGGAGGAGVAAGGAGTGGRSDACTGSGACAGGGATSGGGAGGALPGAGGASLTGGAGGTSAGGAGSGGAGSGGAGSGGAGPVTECGAGLDMWLVVDESGSMDTAFDTDSHWGVLTGGIQAFSESPGPTPGVRAGLVFFPKGDPGAPASCCADVDCGAFGPCTNVISIPGFECILGGTCGGAAGCTEVGYASPALALTALPDTGGNISAALAAETPAGVTPMAAGLDGGRRLAVASASASPSRKSVVVLLTEGVPGGCADTTVEGVAQVASTALSGSPSIPTYVITMGADAPLLEPVSTAGGTTLMAVPETATAAVATAQIATSLRSVIRDACAP